MNNEKEDIKVSKFLSLVLRHKPEEIGIELDENGWTSVQTLIDNSRKAGIDLSFDVLKHVVDTNSKKRFAFNESFDRIRASQGHSIEIELGYQPQEPPEILYHGTGEKSVPVIRNEGLSKQKRHHVHLSADLETAIKVGQRHGKPFVFKILAGEMFKNNFDFFLSDNGVWLTDHVPAKYLKEPAGGNE